MERRVDAIHRYTAQDLGRGRSLADARLRATLRADIDVAIHRHTMMRADAHEVAGLRAGALDDGSLDTNTLRQALAKLRAIPGGMADLSYELGRCS